MYYIYFLLCKDGKIYTGSTNNLRERLLRHSKGQVLSTKDRLPIKLVAYFACENKYTAFEAKSVQILLNVSL